jgi:3-deoxy-manno-octulosonate cytidylyltransferase (CMP-KDO synthetase)
MKVIGFIPARFNSQRFPGKPLALINGKPMIEHVYSRCMQAKLLDDVYVLTEDKKIVDAVKKFGGKVLMTSKKCSTGTERIASIINKIKCDVAVNIQGDEPIIQPQDIDNLVKSFKDKNVLISTIARDLIEHEFIQDPNIVKVIIDSNDFAIYFSRCAIPYIRDNAKNIKYYQHIGLYAYRTNVLKIMNKLKNRMLEEAEKLEQLRFVENGYKIKVVKTKFRTFSVDIPSDIKIVENELNKKGAQL